jgi:hypothetical protein
MSMRSRYIHKLLKNRGDYSNVHWRKIVTAITFNRKEKLTENQVDNLVGLRHTNHDIRNFPLVVE